MPMVERGYRPLPDERVEPADHRTLRRKDTWGLAFDLVAIVAVLVLVGLGLANLAAVDGFDQAARQAALALAGVVLLGVLWRFPIRLLALLGWVTYVAAVILLGVVHVAGVTVNGATRWVSIGGLAFQPSELAKLGLLLVLAAVLGSSRPAWQRFTLALGLAAVAIGFTVLQPDLSTSLLLIAVSIAMLIIGRVPARFLLPLFGTIAVAAPLAVGMLRPYQVQRLGTFLVGAEESPAGAGWAVQQAHIAFAWGSLFGRADHPLTPLVSQYLPEKETDLALASLVQQYGLVAGGLAVAAAIVLVWRLALASRAHRAAHGTLVAGGLTVLIGVEVVVSIGGNLGLLPLAGIPFPLLSYGGTVLIVHVVAVGVALAVRRDGARRLLWTMPRWRGRRPRLVRGTALGLTGVLVMFGLYSWNLLEARGDELYLAGRDQMTRCLRIPAERGMITDRHGTPLAVSTGARGDGAYRVVAVPAMVRTRQDDVDRLAALARRPAGAVRATLDAAPATTLAVRIADVPPATGDVIRRAGITGVVVVPVPRRTYPTGSLLGPVLGWVGVATPDETRRWPGLPSGEFVGRAGLEQQYDAILRGVNGRQCVYVTPKGVPVAMGERVEPIPGANLRLSLDLGFQRRLATSLGAAVRGRSNPREIGAAVAMDVRTGQILAMAGLPSYDNNIYGPPVDPAALRALEKAPGHPTLEHVTQAALPPGSTFKLVVATAGVVKPVFPPRRAIPTGAGFTLGGHTFNNWRAMGPMNMVESIAWSNDVYFYKLAHALGPDPIIAAARAYGVGARTGVDLPGESPGYLGTPESVTSSGGTWYGGSTVILGIGQGYLQVTPLQNALWTAGAATGQLVTPRLGLATGATGGVSTTLPGRAPRPLPFADRLGPVQDGMRRAVTGGTATLLSGLPFPSAGKTGTAEDGSLPGGDTDHWLSAVAPWPNPDVVVTAVVQGPGTGGNDAKPVVADALRYVMDHRADLTRTG
jgi:cell division protein FtsI/penicillin-binding protein 2/cell division protein FtsW (lipid II flippase)